MWEHQNEPFVRDFLQFSHFVASKFSHEFSYEPLNLLPQNRCFVGGFRQFSAHLTKCHVCHGICTLSPLDAALPMRFVKNTQHDASKVLRLPRKMTMDTSKVLRLPRKLQRIFCKRRKSILAEACLLPLLPFDVVCVRLFSAQPLPAAHGGALQQTNWRLPS